jgi:hypothetical protein
MKEISIYSSITAGYDNHNKHNNRTMFSDYSKFIDPRLNAKIYKILSHRFIHTEFSIWVDGNVRLNCKPELLVDMMEDKDILVFKHPDRNCIYKEANKCKELELDNSQVIDSQMNRYRRLQWGDEKGLGSCRIIVRRNTENISLLNCKWWAEITAGSVRDQLSFPVIYDGSVKYIEHPDSYDNKFFTVFSHANIGIIERIKRKASKIIF